MRTVALKTAPAFEQGLRRNNGTIMNSTVLSAINTHLHKMTERPPTRFRLTGDKGARFLSQQIS